MSVVHLVFIVFGITLLIVKSRILACKREYVKKRYEASKLNPTNFIVRWIHRIWHANWSCAMCSGAWWSFVICLVWRVHAGPSGYIADVVISFGGNWLLHCVEDFLFNVANYLKVEKEFTN